MSLTPQEQQIVAKAQQKYRDLSEKQQGGAGLNNFVRRVTSSRVLDLYLKYLGLTTLNSATLVPFALLLGRDYFQKYLMKRVQRGGASSESELIPRRIPFLDNPAIGTFLKVVGIPLVGITTDTLVPLGVLMIVYEMVNQLRSKSKSRSRSRSPRRSMRGGWGSQYATSLSAVDANAPWERTLEQCKPFARASECSAAANVARKIQETINPGVTNAMRGGKRSSKRSSKRSAKRSSKRRSSNKRKLRR
jgi:hypothetical protein